MDQDKINAAVSRASEVVNGFKTVRDQQARDVLALAGVLAQRDYEIEALKRKVLSLELQAIGSQRAGASNHASDVFGQMFGGR